MSLQKWKNLDPILVGGILTALIFFGPVLFRFIKVAHSLYFPHAVEIPKQPFTAVYEVKVKGKPDETMTVSSDGKTRMLCDRGDRRTIDDGTSNTSMLLRKSFQTAKKVPLEHTYTSEVYEDLFLKSPYAAWDINSTGEKTIGDRPCRGWKSRIAGAGLYEQYDFWFDKETKMLVLKTGTNRFGATSARQLSYKPEAMPEEQFQVPSGYEINQ